MIRINLLPYRDVRKQAHNRRAIGIYLVCTGLTVALIIGAQVYLNAAVDDLNIQLSATRKELESVNKIVQEINQLKKKLEVLKSKAAVIESLEANRRAPLILLNSLADLVVVKRMWFTNLTEKEGTVEIQGFALDNKTVADFMTRLEQSGLFQDVTLKTLKQEKYRDNIFLKQFQIACRKPPKAPEKKPAPAAKPKAPSKPAEAKP